MLLGNKILWCFLFGDIVDMSEWFELGGILMILYGDYFNVISILYESVY